MKFEKELIPSFDGKNIDLWVCDDYLGDAFISIVQYETLEKARNIIGQYALYNALEPNETANAETLNGTPVIIIKTDQSTEKKLSELKEYFIIEMHNKGAK